jgi:predicted transcriptional regulator
VIVSRSGRNSGPCGRARSGCRIPGSRIFLRLLQRCGEETLRTKFAYNTVLTVLRTLESKGYVGHKEEGRAHRSLPLIAREAARRSALRHLSAKPFKGSAELLMISIVSDNNLSDAQVEPHYFAISRPEKPCSKRCCVRIWTH